jgi:hypothetical protein
MISLEKELPLYNPQYTIQSLDPVGPDLLIEGVSPYELELHQVNVLSMAFDQMEEGGMQPQLRRRLLQCVGHKTVGINPAINQLSDLELLRFMFLQEGLRNAIGDERKSYGDRIEALLESTSDSE